MVIINAPYQVILVTKDFLETLKKYGEHKDGVTPCLARSSDAPCTCGLSDKIKSLQDYVDAYGI